MTGQESLFATDGLVHIKEHEMDPVHTLCGLSIAGNQCSATWDLITCEDCKEEVPSSCRAIIEDALRLETQLRELAVIPESKRKLVAQYRKLHGTLMSLANEAAATAQLGNSWPDMAIRTIRMKLNLK